MYKQTIKIVRRVSLDDVLEWVRTPRLAILARAIWEVHPNQKIWFSQISAAAHKVAEWLSIGDREWREDHSELELFLDMLDERDKQTNKADEIRLQFLSILINVILENDSPEDLVSRWYDEREEEADGYDEN